MFIFRLDISTSLRCGYFWDNWASKDDDDFPKNDYIKVFLWSTPASGIITLLFFLTFLIGLHKKIKFLNWTKLYSYSMFSSHK
jgi:hypothetical protein